MLGVIGSLAGLIKIRNSRTLVDDSTFRLHYRWTTTLFFLACGLVTASDLVGKPIQCIMDGKEASKPITTYCWVSSTFTINTTTPTGEKGHYHYAGSNYSGIGKEEKHHEKRIHGYYQWVPIILFGMGCMFYLPHLIWKEVEGKRVENLLQGLNLISMDEANCAKRKNIVKYLLQSNGRLNSKYAYGYLLMQVLNMTNVLSLMFLLEKCFGGIFLDLGSKFIRYMHDDPDVPHDPLIVAFPRLAKCTFRQFGGTGTIEKRDALCLLPQNILNEKLFLVFWFWMVLLATFTAIRIVYIVALIASPYLRQRRMERSGKMVPSAKLEALIHRTDIGDYFLLMNIGKNLDAMCFRDILQELINTTGSSGDAADAPGVTLFSPNAPTYRHFNLDEEDPVDYKRRMETEDTSV